MSARWWLGPTSDRPASAGVGFARFRAGFVRGLERHRVVQLRVEHQALDEPYAACPAGVSELDHREGAVADYHELVPRQPPAHHAHQDISVLGRGAMAPTQLDAGGRREGGHGQERQCLGSTTPRDRHQHRQAHPMDVLGGDHMPFLGARRIMETALPGGSPPGAADQGPIDEQDHRRTWRQQRGDDQLTDVAAPCGPGTHSLSRLRASGICEGHWIVPIHVNRSQPPTPRALLRSGSACLNLPMLGRTCAPVGRLAYGPEVVLPVTRTRSLAYSNLPRYITKIDVLQEGHRAVMVHAD